MTRLGPGAFHSTNAQRPAAGAGLTCRRPGPSAVTVAADRVPLVGRKGKSVDGRLVINVFNITKLRASVSSHRNNTLCTGEASTSSASDDSDSDSEDAFILDEDAVLLSDPLIVNGEHARVLGGDRQHALLYRTLEIKEGDESKKYSLFDDCLIRADTNDESKPPYIAKIVAIGDGGHQRQVTYLVSSFSPPPPATASLCCLSRRLVQVQSCVLLPLAASYRPDEVLRIAPASLRRGHTTAPPRGCRAGASDAARGANQAPHRSR